MSPPNQGGKTPSLTLTPVGIEQIQIACRTKVGLHNVCNPGRFQPRLSQLRQIQIIMLWPLPSMKNTVRE
jgi:hypothetical protein